MRDMPGRVTAHIVISRQQEFHTGGRPAPSRRIRSSTMVVRCTKKLLDLLGRSVSPTERPPGDDDWYANLLWLDRRKCLLLVHAGTLFPVFRTDVLVDELRPLGAYVVRVLAPLPARLRRRTRRSCSPQAQAPPPPHAAQPRRRLRGTARPGRRAPRFPVAEHPITSELKRGQPPRGEDRSPEDVRTRTVHDAQEQASRRVVELDLARSPSSRSSGSPPRTALTTTSSSAIRRRGRRSRRASSRSAT